MPIGFFLFQAAVPPATDIAGAVNRFTDFLIGYAAALAAVGALAMALVEAAKKFWDSRTKFQGLRWVRWIKRSDVSPVSPSAAVDSDIRRGALTDILCLCTGISRREAAHAAATLIENDGHLPRLHAFRPHPAHALFALDLGRMMGSIQDAVDVALTSPQRYPDLYTLMTSGADADDVGQWFQEADSGMAELGNADPSFQQRQAIKDLADRLARLRHFTKRKLDGFQLYTGDRWASYNQVTANVAGILVMFGVLSWLRSSGQSDLGYGSMSVFSLLGGILSPIAKDLVNALKRVKDG